VLNINCNLITLQRYHTRHPALSGNVGIGRDR